MTDLVQYRAGDPAGQLIAWADAADAAFRLADSLVRTNVCPPAFRGKPQEATAVILLGAEVGLSPIAALRAMYEIRGQLGMYVRAQVALAQSRGHRIWTDSETDDRVVVKGHRAGDPEHVETSVWTIQRARTAGFIRRGQRGEPSQYESQPRTMLWARAAGEIAHRIASDVLVGIPETEEPLAGPQGDTSAPAAPARVIQRQPRRVEEIELPLAEEERSSGWQPVEPASPAAEKESPNAAAEPAETLPLDLPAEEPPTRAERIGLAVAAGVRPDAAELLADEEPPEVEPLITPPQLRRLQALFLQAAVRGPEARHAYLTRALERPIESTNEITVTEASAMIDRLEYEIHTDG